MRFSRRFGWVLGVWLLLAELTACGGGARPTVGGPQDGGASDGGAVDAGALDAGIPDAGFNDAGTLDAGVGDAGPPDGGASDASTPDAGSPDAGFPDAGASDAGRGDAGVPADGGAPDASTPDSGMEAESSPDASMSNMSSDGGTAGPPSDAGIPVDGGRVADAGSTSDAGAPLDSGVGDAGEPLDAGPEDAGAVETGGTMKDAGVDAGVVRPPPDQVSPTLSTFTASPSPAYPDDTLALRVTVVNTAGQPMANLTVTIQDTTDVIVFVLTTNAIGEAESFVSVNALSPGTYMLTASFGGIQLMASVDVEAQPVCTGQLMYSESSYPASATLGDQPVAVFAADVDGDGKADLLSANEAGDVGLLLTSKATTRMFGGAVNVPFTTTSALSDIASADFNGDGIPDIIVTQTQDQVVGVALGNGDGTFGAPKQTMTGSPPTCLVLGDFNLDGIADVAVLASSVLVMFGNGDGTFALGATLTVGNGPTGIASTDFNEDLIPDLAITNTTDGTVSIYLSQGTGAFNSAGVAMAGTSPGAIAAADLNLDGAGDIVVADGPGGLVNLLLGNGDGTFQAPAPITVGASPAGLLITDVTGDGVPDIGVAETGDVRVLFGAASNADGTTVSFSAVTTASAGTNVAITFLTVGPVTDLATAVPETPGTGQVTVLVQECSSP